MSLLDHHWHDSWAFEHDQLEPAAARLAAWRKAAAAAGALPEPVDAALADDLDTVTALAAVDELAAAGDGAGVAAAAAVLGVRLAPAG